jgi:DNA-binding transcriptional MerR regulator
MKRAKKERLREGAVEQLVSVLREGGLKLEEIKSYLRSEELRNLLNVWADEISDEISQREEIGDKAYDEASEWLEDAALELLEKGHKRKDIEAFFLSQKFHECLDKMGDSNKVVAFPPHPPKAK